MRSYIIAFLMLFSFTLSVVSNAEETTPDIEIDMTDIPKEKGEDRNRGHRMPARHVVCMISASRGVNITGIETSEILIYEILDFTGENILAVYSDEASFIESLFSLNGEYCVHFVTENRRFMGYIRI